MRITLAVAWLFSFQNFCLGQQEWKISDAVPMALEDAKTLPQELRPYLRYLDLRFLPQKERAVKIQVYKGHLNSLSRQVDILPLAPIGGNLLLRVNLLDYGWDISLWEKLNDPYYHTIIETKTVKHWSGGIWWQDNKHYPANAFTYHDVQKTQAIAPWVSQGQQESLKALIEMTQSKAPIVRADWFFNQTAIQEERAVGYYDWLGIKDEKTFQDVIGFDAARADKFQRELREAVSRSGVTLQPRAIIRQISGGGSYWRSLDFKEATGKKNPLRILGKDIENDYDATEQFGHLPNGFWATGLFDGKGKRQNAAPDFIASDGRSKSHDKRVHVNASCIRCHENGGLQDVDGWARNLFFPPLDLKAPDYRKLRELQQQYLSDIKSYLEWDRKRYADAVKKATGMEVKAYAIAYAKEWERYEDAVVDLEWAANDLGTTPKKLKEALLKDIKGRGLGTDTILSGFVLDGERKVRIGIRQWEELYPLAQLVYNGYINPAIQP